jgi:hypothetical protein
MDSSDRSSARISFEAFLDKRKNPGSEAGRVGLRERDCRLIVGLPADHVVGESGRGFEKVRQFRLDLSALSDGGIKDRLQRLIGASLTAPTITAFVTYEALATLASAHPLKVFDHDQQRILLLGAELVDRKRLDAEGRLIIRPGDLKRRPKP